MEFRRPFPTIMAYLREDQLLLRALVCVFLLLQYGRAQSSAVYLSLSGARIPNHGYVNISRIGATGDTALLCHTDRPPDDNGHSGGGWFGPDGTKVHHANNDVPGFRRRRNSMIVRLYRDTATGPPAEGIYSCQVKDAANVLQTVYVGLYNGGGGGDVTVLDDVRVHDDMTLTVDSNLNGTSSTKFTLTCFSTCGPATNVTWTRDSVTVTEGTETVLDDPVTAQYTHTLTVTGRLAGLYTCTAANQKPSVASATLMVQVAPAPVNVTVVQEGPTSISVSWSAPITEGNITGYILQYTRGVDSGCVRVNVYLPASSETYTLSALEKEETYVVSIVAVSPDLPSEPVVNEITLVTSLSPGQPSIVVTSQTATNISLSWSVPSGLAVDGSTVIWQAFTNNGSLQAEESGTTDLTTSLNYTLSTPDSCLLYAITIVVFGPGGNASQSLVIGTASCSTISATTTSGGTAGIISSTYVRVVGGTAVVLLLLAVAVTGAVITLLVRKNHRQKKTIASFEESQNYSSLSRIDLELQTHNEGSTKSRDPHTLRNKAYGIVDEETVAGAIGARLDLEAVYEGIDSDSSPNSPQKIPHPHHQEDAVYEGIDGSPPPRTGPEHPLTNQELEGDRVYDLPVV